MKRFLPLVIVVLMISLSPQTFSQRGFGFLHKRISVPPPPPRLVFPAFHYPPGVVPPLTNMPLSTHNPSLDIDLSRSKKNTVASPSFPTLAKPRVEVSPTVCSPRPHPQPIPSFSRQPREVVRGQFVFSSVKGNTSFVAQQPFVPGRANDIMKDESTDETANVQLPIIGPFEMPLMPSDDTFDDFDSVSLDSVVVLSEVDKVETPGVVEDTLSEENDTEGSHPFDHGFHFDREEDDDESPFLL